MEIEIIEPGFEILTPTSWLQVYATLIEAFGRTCYKSQPKGVQANGYSAAPKFVRKLIKSGHESVIEHLSVTVKIIGDRSMSHQLVRHRLAAYSQESQRYVNYNKKGFRVICPPKMQTGIIYSFWYEAIQHSLSTYSRLIEEGVPPEDARSVLPNAMKTEVVTTFNLRQWRHVFEHRALNNKAQWQIRGIMQHILMEFGKLLPAFFGDQLKRFDEEFTTSG